MFTKSKILAATAVLSLCLFPGAQDGSSDAYAAPYGSSTTVVGQNDPSVDAAAVQWAVDNYDDVSLTGAFDFGDGGIDIRNPGVTLQGPATIHSWGDGWAIGVEAPGVVIQDLELNGTKHTGIDVWVPYEGGPVVIDNNTIDASVDSVFSWATRCELKVTDNTLLAGGYCYGGRFTEGAIEIANNEMQCLHGIITYPSNSEMTITGNTMELHGGDGMFIGAWRATAGTGPEGGDNPPLRITGNFLHLTVDENIDWEPAGIFLGTSAHGVNNALVRGNTITGEVGYGGLVKGSYGSNNAFIGNDLTGLSSNGPQLWLLGGRNNRFVNNRLGSVAAFSTIETGAAFTSAATLVSTINWHLHDHWATPDPVNEGNYFINNDYSLTGLPGWTGGDEDDFGAVLLLDFIQKWHQPGWVPYEEPFVMENFVNESDFPEGTDLCSQVLDLSNADGDDLGQGSNHVARWTACEAHERKGAH